MYSWSPTDVLDLNNIAYSPNRTEIKIKCPVCGGNNCYYNTQKGLFNDFSASCGAHGDSRALHAHLNNLSLNEAGKDIEERLGIRNNNGVISRPERTVIHREAPIEHEIASAEVLDATYRAFLFELVLKERHKNDLLSRGFNMETIESSMYRSVPNHEEVDFFALCKRLLVDGYKLEGVPGFFKKDGQWTFSYGASGIMMPRINHRNLVTGIHVRKDEEARRYVQQEDGSSKLETKCYWFTSKGLNEGTGAKNALHFSCDFIYDKQKHIYTPILQEKGVMLTEGIMKADLTSLLLPKVPVLAVQGVNAVNDLESELNYLKKFGLETVILGYDMDYKTNENVSAALRKTEEIISKCGLNIKPLDWQTDVTVDGKTFYLKGIDDYLAYYKLGIKPVVK